VPDGEPAAVVLAVDSTGQVDLDGLSREVSRRAVAVACVQAANHEVGTVQPLEAVHERCAASDVPLLVDGAAAIGWVPPPRRWDVLAASAHKWGGPAGVGVLAVRRSARWRAPWPTDERERVQPGFVNVPSVLAAAAALQEAESAREQQAARHAAMTDRLRRDLLAAVPDVDVAGHPTQRLGHILSFSCLYVDGEALVTELDKAGFAVASGSACTASALEPSHVLVAMGVLTHGNVRVSLTPETTEADLTAFVEATAEIVRRLRGSTGMGR